MNTFTAPNGEVFDTTLIEEAEGRMGEISIVTATKAPELMSLFNRACFALGKIVPKLYAGSLSAQKSVAIRKAVMIVDVIPGVIAAKKLDKNEATRQAILDLDTDYSAFVEKENEFAVAVMLFKQKLVNMESALSMTKKIYGETSAMNNRPNYNQFNTQFPEDTVEATKPFQTGVPPGGVPLEYKPPGAPDGASKVRFGTPKY
jgi:hypothetical protein